ncbi:MAG: hypothetical protein NDJ94_03695 [Vicinamibacteria bacterium]|nr:hypothetical protein [Vicinamibacteria bacterium]
MRTTLTLDDDVAARLKREVRQTGEPLKTVVNRVLRQGFVTSPREPRERFVVAARDLGGLKPGLSLDNIGELLEALEGPDHR